jgi:NAD(P)H-hydrate epimerase
VVLAGKGNNGGDGYVAARYLRRRGATVRVHALAAPRAGSPAERALRTASAEGVPVLPWTATPGPADLVIDAVFGVGFEGVLPLEVEPWLSHPALVLAVDVPSGLDARNGVVSGKAFSAARTVTFHSLKPGHIVGEGPERCGEVTVADIGLRGGEPVLTIADAEDAPRPSRSRTAHKWSAGSVVVVGGSPGMTGAPLLTAEAALAAGAGAVTIMCPAKLQPIYAAQAPGLLTRGIGKDARFATGDVDEVLAAAARFDVMVVGPGLGLNVGGFATQLVLRWPGRLLVDADGLNDMDGTGAITARQSPAILTPHAGEFSRLTGKPPGHEAAAQVASSIRKVVLLKGNPTFVMGKERWAVQTGGPELATIGTGDVLSGFIAALWARGLDTETAARSGAYWHGVSGAELAQSGTVTASQLVGAIARFAW